DARVGLAEGARAGGAGEASADHHHARRRAPRERRKGNERGRGGEAELQEFAPAGLHFCVAYQAAIAWISWSVSPLAIRSMTVAVRVPERKSCIALTIAARSSPASRGTGDVTRVEAGWQPEHDAAPAGGSADATAAAAIEAIPIAAARVLPIVYTSVMPWFFSGNVRSEEHTSELQSPDHLVC